MAYMIKLNTIQDSVKSTIACLVAAERLRQRSTTHANAAANEAIVEARRSLSDVRALVSDLRHIYAALERTNQSLKNSPIKRPVEKWKCSDPDNELQSFELEDPSSLAMIKQLEESAMKHSGMSTESAPEPAGDTLRWLLVI